MTDARWGAETRGLLARAAELSADYLETLPDRPVRERATVDELRGSLRAPLPDDGLDAMRVLEELAANADPGVIASAGPRYFGFVIGGSFPVGLAADFLTSAWDQNAGLYTTGPATSVMEDVARGWLLDLFALPSHASLGFTTGCQMANLVGLAAGRHAVLARHGWDVEVHGLQGAPRLTVVAGAEAHVTIHIALQLLGLGTGNVVKVEADEQGRMRPDALARSLAGIDGPVLVAVQAGNVNSGAIDPIAEIVPIVRERDDRWIHVDGAFGLWAAADPARRHLLSGVENADSWATDAHKWLNVPYDCGIAIVRDADAHRAAMMLQAAYLVQGKGDTRDPSDWVPDFSRRARGNTVYAVLRSLGRSGVAELVDRCCRIARRMAAGLASEPGVEILNDVSLDQVLVRFGDDDALTREVVRLVQEDGTCWLGGSLWKGRAVMRISVSSWATTDEDADRSVDAILRCWRSARAHPAA